MSFKSLKYVFKFSCYVTDKELITTMDNISNEHVVKRLLRLADLAIERIENGPAFAHLSVLIEVAPDLKNSIKHKFITCLCMFFTFFNYNSYVY